MTTPNPYKAALDAFTEREIADMAQAISSNGFQYEKNKERIRTALQRSANGKAGSDEWMAGYKQAKDTIFRRNQSGCCCKWADDEETIVSMCAAHVGAFEERQKAANGREGVTAHWQEIDKPWPGTNTRAYNGQAVDVLLNGNARIPDVYFDYYSKEFLTCGTDVPVVLEGDPVNKITHWMPHVHPVDGLRIIKE